MSRFERGFQTSSCPSISTLMLHEIAWGFRMRQAVGLWHGTHINIPLMLVTRCWEEILNWILCPSLLELGEQFLVRILISPPHCAPCLFSFRLVFGFPPIWAECSLLWLPLAHLPPRETAVARHNIISAAEREGRACIAIPCSVYSV